LGDVLSQSQIDELLKSMSGGSAPAPKKEEGPKYKAYDFKSPKKFTKDDIKIIHDVFDVYSRLVSSYLTVETRLNCQVKVLSIEEQRYFEFSNALEDYTMMGSIAIAVKDDDIADTVCLMQFSNTITLSIIDRLLGGFGSYLDLNRDFTEIEIMIIRRVMVKMSGLLREAWSDYIEVEPSLMGVETNSRINKSISADDIIVLVTLELEMNTTKNIITLSIPAVSMSEMMGKFSNRSKRSGKLFDPGKEVELRRSLLNRVSNSSLKLNALMGKTTIELGDLITLHPNDIIPLDMQIDENVSVLINDKVWYEAKLGTLNNKKALKIVELNKHQMR
jgi:flagellar motor switch protein FliM